MTFLVTSFCKSVTSVLNQPLQRILFVNMGQLLLVYNMYVKRQYIHGNVRLKFSPVHPQLNISAAENIVM